MRKFRLLIAAVGVVACVLVGAGVASAAPTFSNDLLIGPWLNPPPGYFTFPIPNSSGDSEPAIAFGADGTMAVDGLAWLPFQVNLWKGHFGAVPSFFGPMDTALPIPGNGRTNLGDGDADVDITSAGTVVLADLDIIFNHAFNNAQLGVSVTRCPATATSPAGCTSVLLDQAGADRQWITHRGTTVWVSYHDSNSSSLIKVQRSTDDGLTWQRVASPLAGQGGVTGNAMFNNIQGPIVADPNSTYLYDIFAAGEQQTKGHSGNYNNIYVARSTDGGEHWAVQPVFHAPPLTALNNIFPSLAVDQTTGELHAVWSDGHDVWLSSSSDHGVTWSATPMKVSTTATSLMPWVAARNGKVDVVYYGSNQDQDAANAVWNTYDSQRLGGSWTLGNLVSNTPNRIGAVCTEGTGCAGGTNRELLDLFEVAEDPITNKAAVIYTDTEKNNWHSPTTGDHKLPEIVLAFEQ